MSNYLPTDYQTFIATSRYARWLDKENRRENWGETVERYMENIVYPLVGRDSYTKKIEPLMVPIIGVNYFLSEKLNNITFEENFTENFSRVKEKNNRI